MTIEFRPEDGGEVIRLDEQAADIRGISSEGLIVGEDVEIELYDDPATSVVRSLHDRGRSYGELRVQVGDAVPSFARVVVSSLNAWSPMSARTYPRVAVTFAYVGTTRST